VPDYCDVVKEPIDLTLIKGRLTSGYYKNKEMMKVDMIKMMDNCRLYNDKDTVFFKEADTLQVL
jgi:histone acetyltransferase